MRPPEQEERGPRWPRSEGFMRRSSRRTPLVLTDYQSVIFKSLWRHAKFLDNVAAFWNEQKASALSLASAKISEKGLLKEANGDAL
jgi:hypothetical protein